MLTTLIVLLDYWSEASRAEGNEPAARYSGTDHIVQAINRELSYPDLVEFAAFCRHLSKYGPSEVESLNRWMRVVHNLVQNTDIERPSEFVSAIKSLDQLEDTMQEILTHLANGGDVGGFNQQQIREDRLKAVLLLRAGEWPELINEAEGHQYFAGQIEFLLKFSGILEDWLVGGQKLTWTDERESAFRSAFRVYSEKAREVFVKDGVRVFSDHRWERALLSLGDYTLPFSKNFSLLDGSGKRPTWKMLLRGHMVRKDLEQKRNLVGALLSEIDLRVGIEASLQRVIDQSSPSDAWRRMMAELPAAIECCGQRMFRFVGDMGVYLISRQRTSSEHVELWSFYLKETTLRRLKSSGGLGPFSVNYSSAQNEEYHPSAVLTWRKENLRVEVDFHGGDYRFAFSKGSRLAERVAGDFAEELGFDASIAGSWHFVSVPVPSVDQSVKALVKVVQKLAES